MSFSVVSKFIGSPKLIDTQILPASGINPRGFTEGWTWDDIAVGGAGEPEGWTKVEGGTGAVTWLPGICILDSTNANADSATVVSRQQIGELDANQYLQIDIELHDGSDDDGTDAVRTFGFLGSGGEYVRINKTANANEYELVSSIGPTQLGTWIDAAYPTSSYIYHLIIGIDSAVANYCILRRENPETGEFVELVNYTTSANLPDLAGCTQLVFVTTSRNAAGATAVSLEIASISVGRCYGHA